MYIFKYYLFVSLLVCVNMLHAISEKTINVFDSDAILSNDIIWLSDPMPGSIIGFKEYQRIVNSIYELDKGNYVFYMNLNENLESGTMKITDDKRNILVNLVREGEYITYNIYLENNNKKELVDIIRVRKSTWVYFKVWNINNKIRFYVENSREPVTVVDFDRDKKVKLWLNNVEITGIIKL